MQPPAPSASLGHSRPLRLIFGAAVLVPLTMLLFAGVFSYLSLKASAEVKATHASKTLAEHALRTLRAHETLIEAVDAYIADSDWDNLLSSAELLRFMRSLGKGEAVLAVALLGPNGRQIVSDTRYSFTASGTRPGVFDAEGSSLYLGRHRNASGENLLEVARRRSSAGANLDGMIVVVAKPQHFESFHARFLETREDAIALIGADGDTLLRTPPGERSTADMGWAENLARQPLAGLYATTGRLVAYQRLGNYPVFLAYGLSDSALWADWRRSMRGYAVICLLAAMLLMLAAYLIRERTRREWTAATRYAEESARRTAAEEVSQSKDEFLIALNHELRSPLSAIAASIEVLRRIAIPDPRGQKALQVIGRQLDKLKRLLGDLLDVSRAIYGELSLDKRPMDLLDLARNVATTRPRFRGDVRIEVIGEDVWAQADPARVYQMLENLLDNAEKYGGKHIRLAISEEESWAKLQVIDDGEGIRENLLPRLFEPFMQASRALARPQGDLGLGLTLVQRLAQLQGGSVTAWSEGRGKGSTFTVRLPKAASQASPSTHRPAVGAAPKRRILIVEDQTDARESLQAVLEMEGHEVAVASDGVEGLAKFRLFNPEIVLVDIGLPGMDGYEWGRKIRSRYGSTAARLVALTGYGQDEDRRKAQDAGFDTHLTKPVSYAELQSALQ